MSAFKRTFVETKSRVAAKCLSLPCPFCLRSSLAKCVKHFAKLEVLK